jgi:GDP-mannose 6-dehydrogenase
VVEHGEVLIVGSSAPEVVEAIARCASDRLIVDLVRLPNAAQLRGNSNYRGIAW